MNKIGKKKVDSFTGEKQVKQVLVPFEDAFYLQGFVEFNLQGKKAGAAVLEKSKSEYQFVFGFRTEGFHDTLKKDEVNTTRERIESALKKFPPGEKLTVYQSTFAADQDRLDELDELISKTNSPQIKLLLISEKKRVQELRRSGVRQIKSILIYATYSVSFSQEAIGKGGWLEKAIHSFETFLSTFFEEQEDPQIQYHKFLINVFERGYLFWERMLGDQMKLTVSPMTPGDILADLWRRLNDGPPPELRQMLYVTEEGIRQEITDDVHPLTLLIRGEKGRQSVPSAHRSYVRVKNKYVGISILADQPELFSSPRQQLRYFWEILCGYHVRDTEVVCQITSANTTVLKAKMSRLTKQSNVTANLASQKMGVDVGAQLRVQQSLQDQQKIYEGAYPIRLAAAFIVYRKSLSELREACTSLSGSFQLPARLVLVEDTAWLTWLQTWPISWNPLLAKPFDLRLTCLTSDAPAYLPLTKTKPVAKRGFELIADEGGSPIRIDFVNQHANILVLATTRAGKSVLVSGILTQALPYQVPIVALDFPKSNGDSTFKDYSDFLGSNAAYFDIAKKYNNIFEVPDLRGMSDEDKKERLASYRVFLESALVAMVCPDAGQSSDPLLERMVRSLVGGALTRFFRLPEITQRYDRAFAEGFGSAGWEATPTLYDFLDFFENLDLKDLTGSAEGAIREAYFQAILQFRYWLDSPVGEAIAKPSSFPTDVQLLVFALTNLSNNDEAQILAMSAYSAALRRALSSPVSIFFVDEAPILFEFASISNLIGRLCANGAKAGIRVFISGQEPNSIIKSAAGDKIKSNMQVQLVGRIKPAAVRDFVDLLSYERDIVARNSTEGFFPKASDLYSNWLLDIDGTSTYCRYYPGVVQLAAVANNRKEQSLRSRFLKKFKADPILAMARYSQSYANALRSGTDLDYIEIESHVA